MMRAALVLLFAAVAGAQALPAADSDARVAAGAAHLKQQDYVKAVIELRAAERHGVNTPLLHKSLGLAYYGLRQYQLFLRKMSDANRADPRDAEPYYHLGRYYAQTMNDFEKALGLFGLALERNPGEHTALHFRGVCLQALRREEEAKAAFLAAIRQVEANGLRYGWPHQRLAELLLARDDATSAAEALTHARRAVDLDPDNDSGRATLAKALEKAGRWQEALVHREAAARLNPSEAPHRYLLSRLHLRLGNQMKAAEELKMHEKLRATYGTK